MAGRNLPIMLENSAVTDLLVGGSVAMPTVQKTPIKVGKKNMAGDEVKTDKTAVKTTEMANSDHLVS